MEKLDQKEGFTLIELLVVIAIIGILASAIIVGLQGGRAGANDSRAVSGMSQIRSKAETIYATEHEYTNLSCNYDEEMTSLCTDIANQLKGVNVTPKTVTIVPTAGKYCAYIPLNVKYKDKQDYYCIDSTGRAGNTTTNPNTTCAAGLQYECPADLR
ncbi:MAG TPA: type II secretion system protein [Candidatus Pacearchaeota archaeon]|nr:type II secretion system protein [Candidatus Pacearchaeota archaeon]